MLKLLLDDISDLPEALHDLYEKGDDDKYRLKPIEGLMPVAEAEERINAIDEKKRQLLDEKKQWDALGRKYGKPGDVEALIAKAKSGKTDAVDTEALERSLREEFGAERTSYETKLKTARQQVEDLMFTAQFKSEILRQKGEPDLLLHDMRRRVRFTEGEDGTLTMDILNQHGSPMLGPNGERARPEDVVKEYKSHPTFGRAFEGTGSSGAGIVAGKGKGAAVAKNPFAKETRNLTEAMRISKENPALAEELKRAAGAQQDSAAA